MVNVRKMTLGDVNSVAAVHASTFPRQSDSKDWITCNFSAYPRIQYFIAEKDDEIIGFIEWLQKSGFRKEAVVELEQLGVKPTKQRQGVGRILIEKSLVMLSDQLSSRGSTLKHVIVTTRADNDAQNLYKSALNAQVEATITNLYSADEVLMIARNVLVSKDNHAILPSADRAGKF